MKRALWIIIPLLLLSIFGFLNIDTISAKTNDVIFVSPCETPKSYKIGTIDKGFGLSEAEFSSAVQEAAAIWEKAYGKPLLYADPDSPLTISMKYDTRQELSAEINELNSEVQEKDEELQPKIENYNRRSADLKSRIQRLNEEIRKWNDAGGAPPDEYERMTKEQEALRQETQEINALADSLSLSSDELLSEAETLNKTVDTFNEALKYKPEGGIYILDEQGERIDIHIYDSRQELVHILAHEMGHALGIDHIADTDSIMFSKTNSVITPTASDLQALRAACQKRNVLQLKFTQLSLKLHQLLAQSK